MRRHPTIRPLLVALALLGASPFTPAEDSPQPIPPPPPAWVGPVVAALEDNPRFVMDALSELVVDAPDLGIDPARAAAMRDLAASIRLRWTAGEASEYAADILRMLNGPAASLATPEERTGLVLYVVTQAQAACAARAAELAALAALPVTAEGIQADLGLAPPPVADPEEGE